jgi:MFS transporter, AAHS family, 3-hydroxyphenylpropionic acid transporter
MIGLWYLGLIASLVALAIVNSGFLATALAGFAIGFFVSTAPLPLYYGMAPCYYGVSTRGAGVGVSVAVGRLGAIFGPLLAAALLGAGAGASGVLLALLPITAVAGGATMALIVRGWPTDPSARVSWRVLIGLTGFWPGNNQPPGNIAPRRRP